MQIKMPKRLVGTPGQTKITSPIWEMARTTVNYISTLISLFLGTILKLMVHHSPVLTSTYVSQYWRNRNIGRRLQKIVLLGINFRQKWLLYFVGSKIPITIDINISI